MPETGPLSGLLVADFSRVLAGPYATMLLADLGAEVVKVESPDGDETRTWTPPVRGDVSTYYLGINRGKRSVALDLRDDADLELAHELARRADVMIQNFRPGGLARYGLDYATVSADQPGHRLRLDQRVRRRAGRAGARLRPDGAGGVGPDEPDRRPGRAALPRRDLGVRRHGRQPRGDRHPRRAAPPRRDRRRASTSRSTCCRRRCPAWSTTARPTSPGGVVPYRMGNAHPSVFPYEPLPTADRDLIVAAANDRQFRKLCDVLGIPEVADDPRFARNRDRTANRAELHADPRRAPGDAERRRVVRAARRRRGAVRADQHDRRRVRDGRAVRAGAGRRGRRGRAGGADGPAPDHVLRDPGAVHASAAASWTSTAPSCGMWLGPERPS